MSVETYDCRHCGARMGIAGDFSSDDDYDTQAYFDEEVARHESGACVATAPIEVVPTLDPRAGFISGLQELAELLEWTPDLPLPSKIGTDGEVAWNVWPSMVDDVTAEVARIRRLLPPALWTKNDPTAGEYGAKYYELSAPLHGLTLTICTFREEVCERVVTGTREIEEDVPVAFEKVTKTVEDVEWVCKPLLADA
jgi:hypothetical protein